MDRFFSTPVFFFNTTATTEIYTLSLHDALPISSQVRGGVEPVAAISVAASAVATYAVALLALVATVNCFAWLRRSEEHTSELQSHSDLVCRLLLEKKNDMILPRRTHNSTTHPDC